MPAQSSRSFTPIGTPANGPGVPAGGHRSVDRLCRLARQTFVHVDERAERVVAGVDRRERLVEHLRRLALPALTAAATSIADSSMVRPPSSTPTR